LDIELENQRKKTKIRANHFGSQQKIQHCPIYAGNQPIEAVYGFLPQGVRKASLRQLIVNRDRSHGSSLD